MRRPLMLTPMLLSAAMLLGCTRSEPVASDEPARSDDTSEVAAEDGAPEEIDPRDQYALGHAIDEARRSFDDLEGALARTRAAWIDRRVRWELGYVPALCGEAGPCVALPFDHLRDPEHPIRQGWLPRLELEPAARRDLASQCEGTARCVVELTATLTQLELSTDKPPSLTLGAIEIHSTRPSRDDESWILGARRTAAARLPPARTALGDDPDPAPAPG